MIYALSDPHGCEKAFDRMLEKTGFSDADRLYVLGDVLDRGSGGIRLLLRLAQMKNAVLLRGNHEQTALRMLRACPGGRVPDRLHLAAFRLWLADGGRSTYESFLALREEEQAALLRYLSSLPFYVEVKVGGRSFFLSHTLPDRETFSDFDSCRMSEFLYGEPDYEETYDENRFFVTGHTPTNLIDEGYRGRIWKGNHHLAIDCGAAFGGNLGCVCLDTLEEFYVPGAEKSG